jgi:hypothetical protein
VTALVIFEAIVLVLLSLLVVGLLRAHAEVLRALHEIGTGLDAPSTAVPASLTPAPRARGTAADVAGTSPTGDVVAIAVSGRAHPTLLAFLSTGCGTCGAMWHELGRPGGVSLPVAGTRLVVVTRGPELESPAAVAELAPAGVLTVMSTQAWTDYGVRATPFFVLVDGASGSVAGEGTAPSWDQVSSLLRRASADTAAATAQGFQARERSVDEVLRTAGIGPGHPRSNLVERLDRRRRRTCRGGRCHPLDLVALRRIDAVEHPSAR